MTDRVCVVTHIPGAVADHQRASVSAIARAIAQFMDAEFGGEHDSNGRQEARRYFVPHATLLKSEARALGIETSDDLFGGVVPFRFVGTKSIAHPLVGPEARRPAGWSNVFPDRVRDAVLPGFSAFSLPDARRAACRLLALGAVRLKPGQGIGGRGQIVVPDVPSLDAALGRFDGEALGESGMVVELDLRDATTFSVGQLQVDGARASYYGTQHATTDNAGASAFGGSDLVVARGDFDALYALALSPEARLALDQARAFDAATDAFPGMFASRRNYDVLRGCDRAGQVRSGVLEQSWRLGGASGPEIAALAAFRADPALQAVRASAVERFGATTAPTGAIVHFAGIDSDLGPLVKYTTLEPYEPR